MDEFNRPPSPSSAAETAAVEMMTPPKRKPKKIYFIIAVFIPVIALGALLQFAGEGQSDPSVASQYPLSPVCELAASGDLFRGSSATDVADSQFVAESDIDKSNSYSTTRRLVSKTPFITEVIAPYLDEGYDRTDYLSSPHSIERFDLLSAADKSFINELPQNYVFRASVGTLPLDDAEGPGIDAVAGGLRVPSRVYYDLEGVGANELASLSDDFNPGYMLDLSSYESGFRRQIEVSQDGNFVYSADGVQGDVQSKLTPEDLNVLGELLSNGGAVANDDTEILGTLSVSCMNYFDSTDAGVVVGPALEKFLAELGDRLEKDMTKSFEFSVVDKVFSWDYDNTLSLSDPRFNEHTVEFNPGAVHTHYSAQFYDAIYGRMSDEEKSDIFAGDGGVTYSSKGKLYTVSAYSPNDTPYFRVTPITGGSDDDRGSVLRDMPANLAALIKAGPDRSVDISAELYESQRPLFDSSRATTNQFKTEFVLYELDGSVYSGSRIKFSPANTPQAESPDGF